MICMFRELINGAWAAVDVTEVGGPVKTLYVNLRHAAGIALIERRGYVVGAVFDFAPDSGGSLRVLPLRDWTFSGRADADRAAEKLIRQIAPLPESESKPT